MNTLRSARSLAAASAAFVFAGLAQAATYITQINGNDLQVPINNSGGTVTFNRIEVVWSTSVAFGNLLDETGLTDLTISFYDNSNTVFYTDVAIVGGVRQPIGGISRDLADVEFSGVSGVSITTFDNDLNQVQLGAASGLTYNAYGMASISMNIASYVDGALQDDDTFTVTSQNTTAVPEPASYAALAGLVSLGLIAARRKRA